MYSEGSRTQILRTQRGHRTAYTVLVTTLVGAVASYWGDWTISTNLIMLVLMLLMVQPLKALAGD